MRRCGHEAGPGGSRRARYASDRAGPVGLDLVSAAYDPDRLPGGVRLLRPELPFRQVDAAAILRHGPYPDRLPRLEPARVEIERVTEQDARRGELRPRRRAFSPRCRSRPSLQHSIASRSGPGRDRSRRRPGPRFAAYSPAATRVSRAGSTSCTAGGGVGQRLDPVEAGLGVGMPPGREEADREHRRFLDP